LEGGAEFFLVPEPIVLKAKKEPATTIMITIGSRFIFKRYLSALDIIQN